MKISENISEILRKSGSIEIEVNTKSRKSGIEINSGKIIVDVKSPPENNKANVEIVGIFRRLSGKDVKIVKGFTSKKKTLRLG